MIQKDIDALKKEKGNDTRKYNILDILNNVGSIFTGVKFHYKCVPEETMFEKSIAEKTKLRKEDLMKLNKRTGHKQWIV